MALDEEQQAIIDRLIAEPPVDRATLAEQVKAHMEAAREAFAQKTFFDSTLYRRLGDAVLALLAVEGLSEDDQMLVQAAARYYVEDDDEDGDFSSMLGFEDDALIFNHVARAVGQRALVVELDD